MGPLQVWSSDTGTVFWTWRNKKLVPKWISVTSLILLLSSADFFFFHSETFSMKEAECWYTCCHGLLTTSQISTLNSTDLRKPRWPVWQVRPSKFWHLLLSPAPCVTTLRLIFSAPATLTCLSFSPSLSLQPPSPTMPTLARNTQWWVSFRKSFYHHHHPHLSPRATSIVCYASHLLHWSHCFRIIYMLLPTKMLTPWRQDLYLTHLY